MGGVDLTGIYRWCSFNLGMASQAKISFCSFIAQIVLFKNVSVQNMKNCVCDGGLLFPARACGYTRSSRKL